MNMSRMSRIWLVCVSHACCSFTNVACGAANTGARSRQPRARTYVPPATAHAFVSREPDAAAATISATCVSHRPSRRPRRLGPSWWMHMFSTALRGHNRDVRKRGRNKVRAQAAAPPRPTGRAPRSSTPPASSSAQRARRPRACSTCVPRSPLARWAYLRRHGTHDAPPCRTHMPTPHAAYWQTSGRPFSGARTPHRHHPRSHQRALDPA